jgi:uncharacterized protein (DUF4415 family)
MSKMVRVPAGTRPTGKARDEQKKRLAKLAALPDTAIDFSDIPALTKEQLRHFKHSSFYRPIKQQVTVRLDADVLAWAKKAGRGYQTRINAVLRKAMLRDLSPTSTKPKSRKTS